MPKGPAAAIPHLQAGAEAVLWAFNLEVLQGLCRGFVFLVQSSRKLLGQEVCQDRRQARQMAASFFMLAMCQAIFPLAR